MIRILTLSVVGAVVAGVLTPPAARAETGAELLEACGELAAPPPPADGAQASKGGVVRIANGSVARQGDPFRQGLCSGVVGAAIYHGRDIDPHRRFCVPETVGLREASDEVVRYMMDFPQILHTDFRSIVDAALKRAYPCS
jgi:hypothetical protein